VLGGYFTDNLRKYTCGQHFLLLQLFVRIEFDPDKDEINWLKHGVSLAAAADMDLGAALIEPDQRYPYGEARFQAIGPIAGRLHVLAFTMRGDTVRAISLRKANDRERRRYEQKT
jgi:uncharacterized DUF497 family protein